MSHRMRRLDDALIERYAELLSYDPVTGSMTWKAWRGGGARKAGGKAGALNAAGYLVLRVRELGQAVPVHRLAWALTTGSWPSGFIDHINGDRSDNRLVNLRVADQALNSQNQRRAQRSNRSGLLGAHWHRRIGRFTASIQAGGKQRHLGVFDTAEQAHAAYLAAKQQLHTGALA